MVETAAPTFQMKLGKETRTLMYGFRAFKALGVNPFQRDGLKQFAAQIDIDKAAEWVRAGLLWEYAKGQDRHGQEPPTADDLVDLLDLNTFMATFDLSMNAAGLDKKPEEGEAPAETGEGPPTA